MITKYLIRKKRRVQIKYFNYKKKYNISERYIRLNSMDRIHDYRSDLELANNLNVQGKHDEAELLYRRVRNISDLATENVRYKNFSTSARYGLASNEYNRLDIQKAIEHIESIVYFPDGKIYLDIKIFLAKLYGYIDNPEKALKIYNHILDVDYRVISRIYLSYFGAIKLVNKDFEIESFIRENSCLEKECYSNYSLAKYYSFLAESEKSLTYLEKASVITNEYYEIKANIYFYEGRYRLSREYYIKAWNKKKSNIGYLGMWVLAYLNQNDGLLARLLTNVLIRTPVAKRNSVAYRKLVMIKGDVNRVLDSYRNTAGVNALKTFLPDQLLETILDKKLGDSSILVLPMWGIGDEIMIACIYGKIKQLMEAKNVDLTIATEERLFELLKRSFPSIDFIVINRKHRGPHVNKLAPQENGKERLPTHNLYYTFDYKGWSSVKSYDYVIPAPFAVKPFVRQGFGIEGDGVYLTPKSSLKEIFKKRLNAYSSKPKVGISWRSGFTSNSRSIYYSSLDQWGEIFSYKDKVDFVNLQYDNCGDELEQAKLKYGIDVINFTDVDMFNDLESVSALIASLDMTISPCTVVGDLAGALGVPTLYLINSPEGNWRFTKESNTDIWFKAIEFIRPNEYGDVESLLGNAAIALGRRIGRLI